MVVTDVKGTIRARIGFGVIAAFLLSGLVLAITLGVTAVVGQPSQLPALLLVAGCVVNFVLFGRSVARALIYEDVYVKSAVPPFLPRRHEIFG